MKTHIFTQVLISSTLMPLCRSKFPSGVILSSAWKTSFNICYSLGLLVINSFKLLCLKYVFISSSFLKDTFSGYRTLGWQFFPFSTLKLLLYSSLTSAVSNEKSTDILIFVPQYIAGLFSLATFEIFFFLLVLINLISMWFGIVFLVFCVLGGRYSELLESVGL